MLDTENTPPFAEGRKRALAACHDQDIVGGVVYGLDADCATRVEIRHLSVLPEFRAHRIGSALLSMAERRAMADWPQVVSSILDTKVGNSEFICFAEGQGYRAAAVSDLYGHGQLDVTFVKSLSQDTSE